MLEYLAVYQGKWTDTEETGRDYDVCIKGETYYILRRWVRGGRRHKGYAGEAPDLCLDHSRELGVAW